jgi:hypothetical protein
MRFEPLDSSDLESDANKEIHLFRVAVSHHPIVLYLFLCALFFCGYQIGSPILLDDPLSFILQVFLGGWACFLLLFCLSALLFFYNRIEVTDRRIYGHMFSLLHRHFDVSLTDISMVKVSQLFFAGPLHYGRITLCMKKKRLYIFYVKEPLEVKKSLDRVIALAKSEKNPRRS